MRGTHLEVVVTARAGHAVDVGKSLQLGKYAGIVSCGGDGLIYEIFQGLMQHSNRDAAIQV